MLLLVKKTKKKKHGLGLDRIKISSENLCFKKEKYCIRVHFGEKLGLVWINTYMCVYTYVYTY